MTSQYLTLELGGQTQPVELRQAIIAGWTGRDLDALQQHIAELAEMGVKPPAKTPIFYRVAAARVTTGALTEASGSASSGEVEFCLLQSQGKLWVGAGSDHTDRAVETYNVTVSKQMCDKPIASRFWLYDDVAPHWDQLELRSFIGAQADQPYQQGSVATMRHPDELLSLFATEGAFEDGSIMFCGTLAAIGGIRPSPRFAFELHDPVLNRTISHAYSIAELAMVG